MCFNFITEIRKVVNPFFRYAKPRIYKNLNLRVTSVTLSSLSVYCQVKNWPSTTLNVPLGIIERHFTLLTTPHPLEYAC
jgi:hypothetical protein